MRELERSDQPYAEADIARSGSKIIVSTREERLSVAIKLKRALARFVQIQIVQCNLPPDAKPGATRHGFGQARQVRPHVFVEFVDNEISPIATGPLRRRLLK